VLDIAAVADITADEIRLFAEASRGAAALLEPYSMSGTTSWTWCATVTAWCLLTNCNASKDGAFP